MERTKKTKLKIRKSIRVKVMTMTFIIVIGVMLVCTTILRYSMRDLTKSILLDVLQPTTGQSAKAVASDIHLMADRMMNLATDQRLTVKDPKKEDITTFLKQARNTYEFYGIGIYDKEGNALSLDGDIDNSFSGTHWFSQLQETDNLTIEDPIITEDYIGIPMAMPIKSEENTTSYLLGIYKYDMLNDVLNAIHIGKSGIALIINEDGKIVGHPDKEVVRQELNVYDLDQTESAHQIFDRMLTREIGSGEGIFNGQDAYAAFCPIRGTRWSFAIQVPKTDYMEFTNKAVLNTMIATFSALGAALAFIWLVMTVISSQLKRAITRMSGFSNGDLKTPVEVKNSGDEAEYLSRALKTTIESINGYLNEIKRVLDNISNGNLDTSADGDYQGDFIVVKETLTNIIVSLNQMMKQISQTAYQLMETAQDMGTQSEELHQAASRQTLFMDELNNEVETIQTNLIEVTNNTMETRQRADEIAEQIENGDEKMKDLKTAMEAISKNAQDIDKISKLIEEISKQTSILALNAAVEANRAGEHGKGFAVVAAEIRLLAEQSEEAAKNTLTMIQTSRSLIAEGVDLTAKTSEALEKINKSSDDVTKITKCLSETVDVQATSLYKITGSIREMSLIAEQNSQCAENTADASANLKQEAAKLKKLLEKFKFH